MYYAIIGLMAVVLHFLINSDVIFRRSSSIASVTTDYRRYLNSVLIFYIVDGLWGLLTETNLTGFLYAVTMAYYAIVPVTVVFWCIYVSSYLNFSRKYARILIFVGSSFILAAVIALAVNFFSPVIFDIDDSVHFSSQQFRLIAMLGQLLMFLIVSTLTYYVALRSEGRARRRNRAIAIYSTSLMFTVFIQYFFPDMPLYTIGLMLGTAMLHVFVQEDEKAEVRKMEIRNEKIIHALAQSYEQVNYIDMKDGTYSASCLNFDISEEHRALKAIQEGGSVNEAIAYACDNLVAPSYRDTMRMFTDLSTIDRRMAFTHMINSQFKNYNEVWYEWNYIVADRNDDGSIKHLIWAIRKIEDEKQAEIRKQKILEDNIAANKAKTVFLQNMSHEIRTPLNAMFGFSQLLGMPEGSWTDAERDEYNKYVLNSYYMMDMLIGDIIDIADSEHGNYRININDVQINEICKSALTSAEFRKPADVEMSFTTTLPDTHTVRTDGRRVQQVLINYLTNACKHTQNGKIVLSCSDTEIPGKLVFAVTDTGEGVPEEKAKEIFKRFTKLNQFSQGSGLGLNICQMVASKLGGEVYLDNRYKDGARFVFVIDNK